MTLSLNDQTVLGLVEILVRRLNALQGTLADLAYSCQEPRKNHTSKGPSTFNTLQNAYEPLHYLALWYKGDNIVRCEINGDFFIPSPNLKDRGCLTVVRKLFDSVDTYNYALRVAGEDEDKRFAAFEAHNKIVRKCFVMMQLWDIGEDLTHMALSFDWAR